MSEEAAVCPWCGLAATRKLGRDRRGRQVQQCRRCRRRFTALTGTPFSGERFPPDVIALAVRWYLRYRLSYADVAELLAEWGVRVDPLAIYAWVREFAPPYEDAAHPFRPAVGRSWSVDESDTKIASKPADVIRAIDGRGQVVDVYASQRRATIERDHQHLKGRLRPTRGFKTLTGAQVLCRGYALLRNLRGGFYDLGRLGDAVALSPQPAVVQAWAVLTGMLLGR